MTDNIWEVFRSQYDVERVHISILYKAALFFIYNAIVYVCDVAVVCKQHLVWYQETSIKIATIHSIVGVMTLAKSHLFHFLVLENQWRFYAVNGKYEGDKLFGNIKYIFLSHKRY